MIWPTLLRGFSDEYGSWKIICISRRSGRMRALREARDVPAVEADRARRRIEQPHHQPRGRRLAAARLADDAERLAPAARSAITSSTAWTTPFAAREHALLDREVLRQVLDLDERRRGRRGARALGRAAALTLDAELDARSRLRPDLALALGGQVAGVEMAAGDRRERRQLLVARLEAVLAARVERDSRAAG